MSRDEFIEQSCSSVTCTGQTRKGISHSLLLFTVELAACCVVTLLPLAVGTAFAVEVGEAPLSCGCDGEDAAAGPATVADGVEVAAVPAVPFADASLVVLSPLTADCALPLAELLLVPLPTPLVNGLTPSVLSSMTRNARPGFVRGLVWDE